MYVCMWALWCTFVKERSTADKSDFPKRLLHRISLSWLRLEASVSAAISSWTQKHTQAHTHSRRGWRSDGRRAHLIGATCSLGSWNSSLINRPKYHLIYHREVWTEGGKDVRESGGGTVEGDSSLLNTNKSQKLNLFTFTSWNLWKVVVTQSKLLSCYVNVPAHKLKGAFLFEACFLMWLDNVCTLHTLLSSESPWTTPPGHGKYTLL